VLRSARRHDHADLGPAADVLADPAAAAIEEDILAAEVGAAVRAAFSELPRSCRELLSMLVSDPPSAYADISATLGIAVGTIGPKRARCLEHLRRSRHLIGVIDSGAWDIGVGQVRGERGD
jgi:DNA-directed RNA polymerase specialized sigma24 family protein